MKCSTIAVLATVRSTLSDALSTASPMARESITKPSTVPLGRAGLELPLAATKRTGYCDHAAFAFS
jgi:hypothetical protein